MAPSRNRVLLVLISQPARPRKRHPAAAQALDHEKLQSIEITRCGPWPCAGPPSARRFSTTKNDATEAVPETDVLVDKHSTMNSKTEALDQLMAQAEHYAKSSLRYGGRVPPTALLLGPGGRAMYIPSNLDNEQAKDQFASTVRILAIAHEATAVVVVLEAWSARAVPGEALDPNIPASQAANREEVVALIGEAAGLQKTKFFPIERNTSGAFVRFGQGQMPDCTHAEGRFAQLLLSRPPSPAEKALAQAILEAQGMRPERPEYKRRMGAGHWH